MNIKTAFRSLLIFLLTFEQAFAAGPVIWNGTRSKALTSKGLLLSDNSVVDNDGQLNYIKNGHAEVNVTGWAAYADAAGVVPVDCTGGAPTETVTRTTSTPLVDTGSVLLTKDAANRQGEGISYAFTIDEAYKSQSMMISFQGASGGTYSSSDLGVYIYDVTGTTVITPSTATIASGANNFQVTWTATANTSYRLCVHTKTTSANAYTYKLDKVFVGPYITAVAANYDPATATSGVVDGTNGLKGFADGSAGAAGYLGEVMTASITGSTLALTGSFADYSGATLTLTAGSWHLFYQISCAWYSSSATAVGYDVVQITDSSDVLLAGTSRHCGGGGASTTNARLLSQAVASTVVNVSGSTTYKIRGKVVQDTGTSSGELMNGTDHTSVYYAVRIR